MFEPIKRIVGGSLSKSGENARRIAAAVILEKATPALEALLGEAAQGKLQAVVYRAGRLTVRASHPVWAEELRLHRLEALAAVNQALGAVGVVKDIVIRRS